MHVVIDTALPQKKKKKGKCRASNYSMTQRIQTTGVSNNSDRISAIHYTVLQRTDQGRTHIIRWQTIT